MPNLSPTALPIGLQMRTRVFVVIAGLAILFFILNLVRRKQIREQYSLLWIVASIVLVLTAAFSPAVDRLAHLVGIYYPPAFLFLIAILMILVLQFHFSTVISNLREQNKTLIQDVGILSAEVRQLKESTRQPNA
jgi:hypothetical protein